MCTAEVKLQKAREIIEQFTPILESVTKEVEDLEDAHDNYYDDGLKLYQEKMAEIGYPKPESYYDNIVPGV
jgi:Mg2+ and Co2+ transporter CorA